MSAFATKFSLHKEFGVEQYLTKKQTEQLRAYFQSEVLDRTPVLPEFYENHNWIEPFM